MDKAERKRRAAVGALALLEWRQRMIRENTERENADREMALRFDTMIAEMRAQADAPHAASRATCVLVKGMVHSAGAAGALS
jgi:hypothetical protein